MGCGLQGLIGRGHLFDCRTLALDCDTFGGDCRTMPGDCGSLVENCITTAEDWEFHPTWICFDQGGAGFGTPEITN